MLNMFNTENDIFKQENEIFKNEEETYFKQLPSSKAVFDNIPLRVFKHILPAIIEPLTYIINLSLILINLNMYHHNSSGFDFFY